MVIGPRPSDQPTARSDVELVLDVAFEVVGATLGAGLAVLHATRTSPVVRAVASWTPPFVPARLQPAAVLADAARRGARRRSQATEGVERLVAEWTPAIVDLVLSRLDLTNLVLRHVDIDEVVGAADVDAVAARLDLEAVIQRIDLDAVVGRVDLDAAIEGVDIDAIASRLELDAVIDRIDVVGMVEEVIAVIDLPGIIRDSTGSMASETVRSARMTGISADEAVSRAIERHLFRRRRPPSTPTSP